MKKDFISVSDFSQAEIIETFNLAIDMKKNKAKYSDGLKGKGLFIYFEKDSLRTRVSFDVGIHELGGFSVVVVAANESSRIGTRESIYDVAKNLERMVGGIMMRTFSHQKVVDMAKFANIPVINGLTDYSHPCQAMADYLTFYEKKGYLKGKKLCYVGDGNNVAHSLMEAGAILGVNVTISTPKGFEPNLIAFQEAEKIAKETGAKIEVIHNPKEAIKDADAVYTDVWASMGQESEAAMRKKIFAPYQVNDELMSYAKSDAIFMHCLPAHRGDEVTDSVIDSKNSVVFDEAENRLHVQKAIMYQLMK
ncbi:MAG: ornithine carbamoyltransferase [Candidatus Kapabacteria bacterium]|nr:ornithine carbamoyltransferase [Candidatus Kapabacteria bacterium]